MASKKKKITAKTKPVKAAKAAKPVVKERKKPGPKLGSKRKPKQVYAFKVVDGEDGQHVLGLFATLDAARDAIAAQDALHSELQAPVIPEVSDKDIDAMDSELPTPLPVASAPLMQFDWTIVKVRIVPSDVVHAAW